MELRTLRALVEVVRQGGFSPAAKVLFTTQPSVSKAVRQLEDELGVPLLERIGHRSQPTAAGEIVLRRARAMLAQADDLMAELDELRGLARGVLRLGLPLFGSSVLFAPLFAVYRSRYPGVEIRLVEHGSKRLEELLRAGELDLAATLIPASPDFEWQDVRLDPLVALLPKDHPLAGRPTVKLVELAGSPFILFEEGFALNKVVSDACARRGFSPTVAARSGQVDFIVGLVKAGLGVALLPRLMAEQRSDEAVSQALLDEIDARWHIALIWRRGGFLPHAAKAWLELSREAHAPGAGQG